MACRLGVFLNKIWKRADDPALPIAHAGFHKMSRSHILLHCQNLITIAAVHQET